MREKGLRALLRKAWDLQHRSPDPTPPTRQFFGSSGGHVVLKSVGVKGTFVASLLCSASPTRDTVYLYILHTP